MKQETKGPHMFRHSLSIKANKVEAVRISKRLENDHINQKNSEFFNQFFIPVFHAQHYYFNISTGVKVPVYTIKKR